MTLSLQNVDIIIIFIPGREIVSVFYSKIFGTFKRKELFITSEEISFILNIKSFGILL